MPASEQQLYHYASIICSSTSLPVILQDYNPGGSLIGFDFVMRLSHEFENFRFIKYEVPGIGPLVSGILEATQGKVKVFSGWGATYMLEQVPAGIAGIMPGIPLADYFMKLWNYATAGNMPEAMAMYAAISPYLAFSLQNLEMFHHVEKRLAVKRGIMKSAVVRSVSVELDTFQLQYLDLVLNQTCEALERFGFRVNVN
jgi:4-hydroxy-tetrahydrodipicolinate synthase